MQFYYTIKKPECEIPVKLLGNSYLLYFPVLISIFYHFPAIFSRNMIGEVQIYPLTPVIDISNGREGQSGYRGEGVIYANREVQTYVIILR